MRVEPAAALEGHFARPGRQVDLPSRAAGRRGRRGRDARPRLRPLGDTESTLARRARARRRRSHDVDTLIVNGVGLRGLRAPAGRSTAATPARSRGSSPACSRSRSGEFTLTGDESLSRRPMERVATPLRQMGAALETTDGRLPLTIDGSRADGDRLRAAGRERPGEVGGPPRRARRAQGARPSSSPRRPATTPS